MGQIDISQPLDISRTVALYTPEPTLPTPPVIIPAASVPAAVQQIFNVGQQQGYEQAQAAAFRQGFAPPATFKQWLEAHSTAVYVGVGIFALAIFAKGRR